jgi:hypothetical protein
MCSSSFPGSFQKGSLNRTARSQSALLLSITATMDNRLRINQASDPSHLLSLLGRSHTSWPRLQSLLLQLNPAQWVRLAPPHLSLETRHQTSRDHHILSNPCLRDRKIRDRFQRAQQLS